MADETPDALRAMALASRAASRALQALSSEERVAILHRIADGLLASQDAILAGECGSRGVAATGADAFLRGAANAEDVAAAKAAGTAEALLARLYLTPAKLAQLAGAPRPRSLSAAKRPRPPFPR
jgi:gamma-glutamyl phosphate reductase